MSWGERDYSADSDGRRRWSDWAPLLPTRGAWILIGVHVAGFLLFHALRTDGGEREAAWFLLQSSDAVSHPAAIVLHALAQPDVLRLLSCLIVIWLFGSRIEEHMGSRELWRAYVVGTLVAGAAYWSLARAWPAFAGAPLFGPVGAFAAWVVLAQRALAFEYLDIFGTHVSVARLTLICAVVWVVMVVVPFLAGALAWVFAVCAVAVTTLVIGRVQREVWFQRGPVLRAPAKRRRRQVVVPSVPSDERAADSACGSSAPDEAEIDAILAKISRDGMSSLTAAERERLDAARRAKLGSREEERV